MSRILYPDDISGQLELLTGITAKNTDEGDKSPLTIFLKREKIDLVAAGDAAKAAKTCEDKHISLINSASNYSQMRDLVMNPVFVRLKAEVQFLKTLNGSNFSELLNWGVPIDAKGRITYPTDFNGKVNIFDTFYSKHSSYAAGESPLQPYLDNNDVDIEGDAAAVIEADGYNTLFEKANTDAVNQTQQRDLIWKPVMKNVRKMGTFLKRLFGDKDRQLMYWGFKVEMSASKQKERTTKLKLGTQRTITSVVLGSMLENTGTVEINVYKGKKVEGTPAVVKAGEKLGIEKGMSTITVVNPSKLETAVFQVLGNR